MNFIFENGPEVPYIHQDPVCDRVAWQAYSDLDSRQQHLIQRFGVVEEPNEVGILMQSAVACYLIEQANGFKVHNPDEYTGLIEGALEYLNLMRADFKRPVLVECADANVTIEVEEVPANELFFVPADVDEARTWIRAELVCTLTDFSIYGFTHFQYVLEGRQRSIAGFMRDHSELIETIREDGFDIFKELDSY